MPRPLLSLGANECRWPVPLDGKRGEPILFCAEPTVSEKHSYCPLHHGQAYRSWHKINWGGFINAARRADQRADLW